MTACTLKYPWLIKAIHALALLRPGAAKHEPYLSASLNEVSHLPIHTDRSNFGTSWTISFGDYRGGGRLWVETPTGTKPPPAHQQEWENRLRGEFVDTYLSWTKFDARTFHSVEPVKSGRRMSLTLFTPAQWDKIPDPIMSDLIDHGFYPPTFNRRPSGARVEEENLPPRHPKGIKKVSFSDSSPLVLSYPVSENDLAHGLFGSDSFRFDDIDPTTEEAIEEQGWAIDMGLLNPLAAPAVDDGNLPSMTPTQHREWQTHVQHGHLKKSYLCRGCILAEGPRRQHRSQQLPSTHVMHIDVAGPYTQTTEGFQYFLVGALRLEGFPLLLHVKMLKTRGAAEICARLWEMLAFFEGLESEGFYINPAQQRVRRIHSDRAKEFVTRPFQEFCTQKGIRLTTTAGYEPQSNGTAERAVGLIKSIASRCLHHAQLPHACWNYAAFYAAQCFLLSSLQQRQVSPPFGAKVLAQVLNPKGERFPEGKAVEGRLLFWDHLQDKSSFLLVTDPENPDDFDVIRAKLPTLSPPLPPDSAAAPPDVATDVPAALPDLLPTPDNDPDDDVIIEFDLDANAVESHPPTHTLPPLVGGNGASDAMPTNLPSDSNRWEGCTEATQDQEEQAVDNYPWVLTTCPDDYDKAFVCGLDVEQAAIFLLSPRRF